jgi:MFS family permease
MTVTLATFMEVLDTSIANVALPHIAGSMGASPEEATWVLTSYLVSSAIILPISGWLMVRFGRKRFYMACVMMFTVCSLLCGLAPTLPLLILARIFAGPGRRRVGSERTGDRGRFVPGGQTRTGLRGIWDGGGLRARHRTNSGRMDH